ncbi:integrator complex subunit 1 [Ditylenchus destructor]|uniref:Integrator complex subunit 1 n=1 Tax=Ditylenchus destructor TaxID=166010 RepID=A0AAD4N8L1_9BILA|nr:integrator complex subunit 1 [Ditylenchus destructor]
MKPGGSKPKPAAPSNRQELKARLGAHILSGPQKRGTGMQQTGNISKRPRLDFKGVAVSSVGPSTSTAGTSGTGLRLQLDMDLSSWKEFASLETGASDFITNITDAKEKNKPNRMARLVCSAARQQLSVAADDVNIPFLGNIVRVVREEEYMMKNSNVIVSLFNLMNNLTAQSASDLVDEIIALISSSIGNPNANWPLTVINLMLNDSLGIRNWVDRPNSSTLVQSICSLFGNLEFPSVEAYGTCEIPYNVQKEMVQPPKFNKAPEEVESALQSVLEFFEKHIRMDVNVSKNLLKTLTFCASNPKIRLLSAQKLDAWLQNGKLQSQAKELLLFVASNIRDSYSENNLETFVILLRLRSLRSKQIFTVFQAALRDMLNKCPDSISVFITMIVDNEFSQNKFQHNMSLLWVICNYNFTEALEVISKLLINRLEQGLDNAKSIRIFLRDFFRSNPLRADFPFSVFAKSMFVTFRQKAPLLPATLQDAFFRGCIDVCSILPFVSIPTTLKDSNRRPANTQSLSLTQDTTKFHSQLKQFLSYSLDFLKWAKKSLNVESIIKAYHALLYIGGHSHYASPQVDNWPNEMEFNQLIRVIAECPIEEHLIEEILDVATQTRDVSVLEEWFTLLETLTKRCISVRGMESGEYDLINNK